MKEIKFDEWEELKDEVEETLANMNNDKLKDLLFRTKEMMEYNP